MNNEAKLDYTMTLRLKKGEIFFGPGVAEVLFFVSETGSLSKAAKEMNMSYNKAWRILQKAEKCWGQPLIESIVGGKNGGGSQLTTEGQRLLTNYQIFEKETYSLVDKTFERIFSQDLNQKK